MHHLQPSPDSLLPVPQPQTQPRWQTCLLALSLATAASGFFPIAVRADRPETAPADLKAALTQIDAAANRRDVEAVVQFYAPTFRNSDGLTRQTLQQALTNLWQRYPTIAYKTELKSWKQDGAGIQAETVTRITGTQKVGDRTFQLDSTLQAQQRFENQKIVQQEILNERSQITSGSNPPKLKLNLPQQVKAGQEFSLDAIVQEPLGTDLLLGAALEEPVKPDGFVNATNVNLEPLPGGGIFKVGRAPATAENRWISAVVMRQDGFTMVTQRLRVVSR